MANPAAESGDAKWTSPNAYVMAGACLVIGLAFGYLLRGSEAKPPVSPATTTEAVGPSMPPGKMHAQAPSLEDMKRMADTKAAPLLAKLKADPNNPKLLVQVAALYSATHQFNDAAAYYNRALAIDPKNVLARTEMASCLYYTGDVDGALGELQRSLSYDPNNANALFNLGMIKWKGKNDGPGALAAWQALLKTNPQLDRKPVVEKMIAEVKQGSPIAAAER